MESFKLTSYDLHRLEHNEKLIIQHKQKELKLLGNISKSLKLFNIVLITYGIIYIMLSILKEFLL